MTREGIKRLACTFSWSSHLISSLCTHQQRLYLDLYPLAKALPPSLSTSESSTSFSIHQRKLYLHHETHYTVCLPGSTQATSNLIGEALFSKGQSLRSPSSRCTSYGSGRHSQLSSPSSCQLQLSSRSSRRFQHPLLRCPTGTAHHPFQAESTLHSRQRRGTFHPAHGYSRWYLRRPDPHPPRCGLAIDCAAHR